jgi:peroxiredoxin Q/BCP
VQGSGFRDHHDRFEQAGAVILGASFDDEEANRAFAEKFDFPFELLCDTDKSLGLAYGACSSVDAAYPSRITYVIGGDGRIAAAFEKVRPKSHAEDVLAVL